jgi:Ras-related protein Rab-1A
MIVGNSGVGKSCLLLRFSDDAYCESHVSTIGVDFKIKTLQIAPHTVKLQIWDTAGQDRFRSITSSYYRGAHGVLVVFDVGDRSSFEDCKTWLMEVERWSGERVQKLLLGNKADLPQGERQVSQQEAESWAQSQAIGYLETSAKNSINVGEAFITLATLIKEAQERTGVQSAAIAAGVNLASGVQPPKGKSIKFKGGACC